MYPNYSEPTEAAPEHVRVIRELGHGRAAKARLVDATFTDGTVVRCVEKVFRPGWLTKTIYRICFFSPFAYQFNRHAIHTSFFRRRVAAEALRRAGVPVDVAMPIYVRFDQDAPGWILAAEYVEGRGIRPKRPGDARSEIDELLEIMRAAKAVLIEAGLTGSGWQIDPRAMVSTANLLRHGDRYTIVDLESGIPALLVPSYIRLSMRGGSLPPFDDLDEGKLLANATNPHRDVEALIHYSNAWKSAEPAPLRRSTWSRLVRRLRRRAVRLTRGVWHLFTRPRYQSFLGRRHVRRSIRRWHNEDRITTDEARHLRDQLDGREVSAYLRGMVLHLTLKPLAPIVLPAKYGGIAATFATGNYWFLLPWLILPVLRTSVTTLNWLAFGRKVRHAEALIVGCIPSIGSIAFPVQIYASRRSLASFLIRDTAARLGRRIPIYGGKDSRTEIAMIQLADRFIGLLEVLIARATKFKRFPESIPEETSEAGASQPTPILDRSAA